MNRLGSYFCKIFLKPVVGKVFIKEVKGIENIPKENFILASNHQSHLDIVICGYLCVPRKFTYIGQTDRYVGSDAFLRNLVYFLGGVIPVNRKDDLSKKEATKEAIRVLEKGYSLVIYPEGTRSRTGQIQEGKIGVAKISLKSKVQILPVGIRGTFELLPPGGGFPKLKKIVKVNIGKPLYFQEEFKTAEKLNEDSEEYKRILQKITNMVMEEIQRLIV